MQQKTEDLSMYLKLLSFLDTSALIVAAAAANDASTVRDFLSRKPQEVAYNMLYKLCGLYFVYLSLNVAYIWSQNGFKCMSYDLYLDVLQYSVAYIWLWNNIVFQVDFKVENRTAIHVACANGSVDVLKVLLEYKANTEIPVSLLSSVLKKCIYPCDTITTVCGIHL